MIEGMRRGDDERPWDDRRSRSNPLLGLLAKVIAGLIVVAAIAAGLVVLRKPLAVREQLRAEIAALEDQRDLARAERDRAARVVEWIKHDPGYLEIVARDSLDVYQEGETVFRFDPVRVGAPVVGDQ